MPLSARSNGQTIDETWFNTQKDAIEALQDVNTLAYTGLKIPFEVLGYYSKEASMNGVMYYRVSQDVTVLSAVLKCIAVGSAGSTQVDIKRKRGAGAFTSLFTTKPSIPYTAGDYADSVTGTGATAAVIDTVVEALLIGDLLRFDFTAVQTAGNGVLLDLVVKPTGV